MDITTGLDTGDLDVVLADGRPPIGTVRGVVTGPAVADWLTEHRPVIRAVLDLHGSLLIRGLPLNTLDDFAAARGAVIDEEFAYREKATPRSAYGQGLFSSTDMPPAHDIRLHNENSYTLSFAGILLFGCLAAPATGGATPVADSREVLAALPPELAEKFATLGYMLYRNYHPHLGLPWTTALGVESREDAERFCRENVIAWRWLADDRLLTGQRRPAVITHPRTGDRLWFNHIAFWNEFTLDPDMREVLVSSYGPDGLPFNTAYGDGTPIGRDEADALNDAYRTALRREAWRPGDLMIVDNLLSSHGRDAYHGDRRIVVAMGEPVRVADCRPGSPVEPGPLPV